ncbi:MAG: SpoIIE family protein phosphatase [Oscillospiraceae bacterium]
MTGQELSQITRDHSVVQMMVEKGQITTEEARIHPQKNYITRALGVENSLEIDYCEVELGAGDRLLLCTDGLTNYLDESAIFEVLQSENSPDAACEKLIEGANAGGGRDNITVVLFVPCEG